MYSIRNNKVSSVNTLTKCIARIWNSTRVFVIVDRFNIIFLTQSWVTTEKLLHVNSVDILCTLPHSFLLSHFQTCCRILLTSLVGKWGNDWSHDPFIRRSPSWDFLGYSSAVRQLPGDMCTAPRIISLSPFSLATGLTDATLGASGLWIGTRTGVGGITTLA